jgi:hypothetical protein
MSLGNIWKNNKQFSVFLIFSMRKLIFIGNDLCDKTSKAQGMKAIMDR